MKKSIYTSSILILLLSCNQAKENGIERIAFTSKYKFNHQIEAKVSKDTTSWKYQMSAVDYASKGDYRNALRHWDMAMGTTERSYSQAQKDSIAERFRIKPAKAYIIERAPFEQIIVLNEAHHSSRHRFFTKSILKELYELGYRNLGLEGLSNGEYLDTLLFERGYPIQETGWYIIESQFANLVREALEIGYHVFPYEQTSGANGRQREIEQAKNIAEIIKQKPNEKFLIHCGFDHVLEGVHSTWGKAMAERLKEYSGIDPFTVNQVAYGEKSEVEFNHPLLKAINPEESVILLDEDNNPLKYEREKAWADIALFHPTTEYIDNRPNWLFQLGNIKTEIDLDGIDITYPILVMAFKEGEDIQNAIPVDIHEIATSTEKCILALKEGKYQIVVTNGSETIMFGKHVD